MRILIIEDEVKAASYVQKGLHEHGITADIALNATDGLHMAATESYDLIILDVMLPDGNGLQLYETLKAHGLTTPVIVLSALGQINDRLAGLNLGVDDYLVKPFSFLELLARIRNIVKRQSSVSESILTTDDLILDLQRHKAVRSGTILDLTSKEFQLLALLLRKKGEVQTRTGIAEQIWGICFDTDTNIIDVAIRRLRCKVDDPFPHKLIKTIRGVGYVIE